MFKIKKPMIKVYYYIEINPKTNYYEVYPVPTERKHLYKDKKLYICFKCAEIIKNNKNFNLDLL